MSTEGHRDAPVEPPTGPGDATVRTPAGPGDATAHTPAGPGEAAVRTPAGPADASGGGPGWALLGVLVVLLLGAGTRYLDKNVPGLLEGTALEDIGAAVEYPVYAIILGLAGNALLTASGLRDRLAAGFRTEFFIKTGLVLLGASINLKVIVTAAGPAIIQAIVLITTVFLFTWWLGGRFGLDDKLRALLSAAVSICGVSAAIAAAGAVQARREQLAYSASLVIAFALPSIFILPWLAGAFGLSPEVAGAWIGGNIDTTAAVTAAGAIVGDDALAVASIVKVTQNALIGIVTIALTAYFAFRIERRADAARPGIGEFWRRFPKFVLGFVAASVIATWWLSTVSAADGKAVIGVVNDLRVWFLILAFVSIGLEFRVASLREAGWRPVGVFAAATVVNVVVALGLALLLFSGFHVT
ncbi:YeiH family protein [Streptosporangium sp. NBC_01756]|uniref:YeiH family protein n=1 Tax=Streptosporangium sp. NBC_01756 TaxID=2975950 RepID=UPI002DD88B7D|nr:putative sulfate exporter family transporter [Streptosporangium sp. NBC_01756]WSC84265.1 putative sulfate exporter family transporter [Streptosporangium sp. NBC_01756]